MKILLLGTSFQVSYGGPAVSVSALANAIALRGVSVAAWAPDGSAAGCDAALESGVSRLKGGLAQALAFLGAPDIIHDNGIWLPHNHLACMLTRRYGSRRVISPRGMLDPWALSHKRWKKEMAWLFYQRSDLKKAHRIHATSATECANIQSLQLGVPVTTIPNGLPANAFVSGKKEALPFRTAIFMGRLHPVKGLDMLLTAWAAVRPPNWRLVIAGPDEGGFGRTLLAQVARDGLSDVVEFVGPIQKAEKNNALANADLFVLPSLSESFGMAIAEALAAGLPVITTTAAPWPELVSEGIGWRVAPTAHAIEAALRQATNFKAEELAQMGHKGHQLVRSKLDWDFLTSVYLEMYEETLSS